MLLYRYLAPTYIFIVSATLLWRHSFVVNARSLIEYEYYGLKWYDAAHFFLVLLNAFLWAIDIIMQRHSRAIPHARIAVLLIVFSRFR